MIFTPSLVSGIGALLYSAIGCVVGMLGPELLLPVWRIFGARSVPLSRFASTGLGLFGGFIAGLLTPFFAPASQMFYTHWWGFLLAAVKQNTADEADAYERLLTDAMNGDATLFVRQDSVEAAWAVVEPVLDNVTPLQFYEPGSWGPREADRLATDLGGWDDPAGGPADP